MYFPSPDSHRTPSQDSYAPYKQETKTLNHHSASIFATLPTTPNQPLTPPDSDPFKRRSRQDCLQSDIKTPPNTTSIAEHGSAQVIVELQFQNELLTSQRAIDKQAISRLEAGRDAQEAYDQQRDGHRNRVIEAWSEGLIEISRLDRILEECKEFEKGRFEKQVQDSRVREEALSDRNEELRVEVVNMEKVVKEHAAGEEQALARMADAQSSLAQLREEKQAISEQWIQWARRDRESKEKSRVLMEAAIAERDAVDARNKELRLIIADLEGFERRFWGVAASLLAVLVMIAVLCGCV